MRPGTPSHVIALVVAVASAAAGCGGDELFEPELASNERLIDKAAIARVGNADESLADMAVVGDLDGDGIDDAVLRTLHIREEGRSGEVHILYGGDDVKGDIEISELPSLTGAGEEAGVSRIGDFNGDGLADFLVGSSAVYPCYPETPEPASYSGAYLVYGSATRFAGATPLADAGAFLRDATPCTIGKLAELQDLDGDDKADFAIASAASTIRGNVELFVYYGRSERLSGTVDLATRADAVIRTPTATSLDMFQLVVPVGDVDGDGHSDFLFQVPQIGTDLDVRLVRGAAARLSGDVVLADVTHTRFVDQVMCFATNRVANALGDIDRDGRDDFTLINCPVTSPFTAPGHVSEHRVFHGRAAFPPQLRPEDGDAVLTNGIGGVLTLATADVDGDGLRELVAGHPYLADEHGAVHVIPGDGARLSSGDPTASGTAFIGTPQRGTLCEYEGRPPGCVTLEHVGTVLRTGDLTGDGLDDILVSAPSRWLSLRDSPGSALGHAYVLSLPGGTKP